MTEDPFVTGPIFFRSCEDPLAIFLRGCYIIELCLRSVYAHLEKMREKFIRRKKRIPL